MKRLLFSGLSVLLVVAATTPVWAAGKEHSSYQSACEAIPIAQPTGGADRERHQAIQRCYAEVMLKQQQAMMAEMKVMKSQLKAMAAQIKGIALSNSQSPETSTLTNVNPSTEVPSPARQVFEQQQAIIAEMEAKKISTGEYTCCMFERWTILASLQKKP